MSIVTFVAVTFGLIGFSMAGIAFWAVMYPKFSCRKVNPKLENHNVCIRVRGHKGLHMSYDGKEV